MRRLAGWIGFLLAVVLAPTQVDAHPASLPPEEYVRFLSDCSDDWGGHSAARDGHDLVALDVTERWIPEFQEPGFFVMMTLGFGYAEYASQRPSLREDVTMRLAAKTLLVRLVSSDNKAFRVEEGTGLTVPDVLLDARPSLLQNGMQDGSRFLLEFGFRYSTLGLAEGGKVLGFLVQGFAGSERGDYMPGGYYLAGQDNPDCPFSGTHGGQYSDVLYIRRDYELRGVERPFLEIRLGTDKVHAIGNQTVALPVTIKNKLARSAQNLTLTATGPSGWNVSLDPSDRLYLPAQGTVTAEVLARGDVPKNGTLLVAIESGAGAHAIREVPLTWSSLPILPAPEPDRSAPASAVPFILLALAAVALLRRT